MLDDRSLNGVFCNGEKVDLAELNDGDEIAVGRFRLYFLTWSSDRTAARRPTPGAEPLRHNPGP